MYGVFVNAAGDAAESKLRSVEEIDAKLYCAAAASEASAKAIALSSHALARETLSAWRIIMFQPNSALKLPCSRTIASLIRACEPGVTLTSCVNTLIPGVYARIEL